MMSEGEIRIYNSVLSAVLWGTNRDEIFEMLEDDGIVGGLAEALYERARDERIGVLRRSAFERVVLGALMLAIGVGAYCFFLVHLWFIGYAIFVICAYLTGRGIWWIVGGGLDALMASRKEGPVEH